MDEYIETEHNEIAGEESHSEPLCTLDITLNEQEIFLCLSADEQRSHKRLGVQSVILLLMAAYWLIGFATDSSHPVSSFVFGAACVLLIAAMWLVPSWEVRRRARLLAEDAVTLYVQVFADRLEFGGNHPQIVAVEDIRPVLCGDVLVLDIGTQTVGIPRRIAGDERFAQLTALFHVA